MEDNREQTVEKKEQKRARKIIFIIIFLLLLIGFTVGISYYFFSKVITGNGNQDVITTEEVSVFYLTGQDINVENMMPGYENDAPRHTFLLENNGKSSQKYTMSFANVNLQQAGKNVEVVNLKWILYGASQNYSEQKKLASGDFAVVDSTLPILENITIEAGERQYYVLKIWLEEIEEVQNEDQGLNFSAQIGISLEK